MKKIASEISKLLKGVIKLDYSLCELNWFKVGGSAELFFEPLNIKDLQLFLKLLPKKIPVTVIGAGSNILVGDGGIEGAVIKLNSDFKKIEIFGNRIKAFAGAYDSEVCRFASKNNKSGLEFLIGIPGTIGGGLRMNAGCGGKEFKDVVLFAEGLWRDGTVFRLSPKEMSMTYRKNNIANDCIFTSATFISKNGSSKFIKNKVKKFIQIRATTQPQGVKTGGSTFTNPKGKKAWELINDAGCKNLKCGNAIISDKHCNFIINEGGATADEIENLANMVSRKVFVNSGIKLKWEIKKVGKFYGKYLNDQK